MKRYRMSLKRISKKYNGFSLIEILVALTIFMVIIGSVAIFSMDAVMYSKNEQRLVSANNQLTQLMSGVIDFKDRSWSALSAEADGQDKYFLKSGATFSITDGTQVVNGVTKYFSITTVYRDEAGNIVSSGGELDPYTLRVTATVEWTDIWGDPKTTTVDTYLNKWDIQRWRNDTEDEYSEGTFWQTQTTLAEDGEVTLELVYDYLPNWCNPALSTTYHDIPGSGIAATVDAIGDKAYLGTGANASGIAFTKADIDTTDTEPVVTLLDDWDNAKVNHIFVDGDYAFLSSDTNAKEIFIIQHHTIPYAEVGYVDAPSSVDARTSFKHGNYGYIGQGRVLVSFDATAYTGSRTVVDTLTLGGTSALINSLYARGDYMFVGVEADTYELFVVDISNPADLSIVNQFSVNSMHTTEIYLSEDQTRLFLLTTQNGSEDEMFLLDVTDPEGTISVVNSIDITTMNTTTAAIVEENTIIVIAGDSLNEEDNYRVFTYEDELDIVDCGGLYVDDPITDISATLIHDDIRNTDNYYTYALTSDANAEFQIVRGDEGEIGGQGYGYRLSGGTYDSLIYDTGASSPDYLYFNWVEVLNPDTDIQFQIRTAATSGGILTEDWVGPDDTDATYYTDPTYAAINAIHDGNQYIQFKAYLYTTNSDYTPELHKIDIFFEE